MNEYRHRRANGAGFFDHGGGVWVHEHEDAVIRHRGESWYLHRAGFGYLETPSMDLALDAFERRTAVDEMREALEDS